MKESTSKYGLSLKTIWMLGVVVYTLGCALASVGNNQCFRQWGATVGGATLLDRGVSLSFDMSQVFPLAFLPLLCAFHE